MGIEYFEDGLADIEAGRYEESSLSDPFEGSPY
jgi:hypothetical protein